MSLSEYMKAYKSGKKEYQTRLLKGLHPTVEVLDELLPTRGTLSEVPLGLVQIPMDQIVGTKTKSRSSAFAHNFMPILRENTEFAYKWSRLSDSHEQEGIREPIKAYEYMNRFYVEEGNKRVSVMKHYNVAYTPGTVVRIIPKKTEETENRIYFEFLDFYEATHMNNIWFSKVGSFPKLQKMVGKQEKEPWTEEERRDFNSAYTRFTTAFQSQNKNQLSVLPGDAFLALLSLYGYAEIRDIGISELKKLIADSWEEFELLEEEKEIDLKMDPAKEKPSIFSRFLPLNETKLKIAFLYDKTPASSAWTYAHELGRQHLEECFADAVETLVFENVTEQTVEEVMEEAIQAGCNLIFTTTPVFVTASVKAAIANPDVRILSCSLNTSHRYIRTYYARMYEAKFLMGALAGLSTEKDRIVYLADYPIYGEIANINAFALGVRMVNPKAKVYLEWFTRKGADPDRYIRQSEADYISGKDMVIPEANSRMFGVYRKEGTDFANLAMPVWHWGRFYEQLIQTIFDGTWKYDDAPEGTKAINYWWGMSAEVVDVICSGSLPEGTRQLTELLKETIRLGIFHPFTGTFYDQEGVLRGREGDSLSPEEIITMDWLVENIEGEIPDLEELEESFRPVVLQQGLPRKKKEDKS